MKKERRGEGGGGRSCTLEQAHTYTGIQSCSCTVGQLHSCRVNFTFVQFYSWKVGKARGVAHVKLSAELVHTQLFLTCPSSWYKCTPKHNLYR